MSRKVDLFPAPMRRRNPTLKAFCVYCAALLADRGQERTLQIADLALRAKKDPIQTGRLDAQISICAPPVPGPRTGRVTGSHLDLAAAKRPLDSRRFHRAFTSGQPAPRLIPPRSKRLPDLA